MLLSRGSLLTKISSNKLSEIFHSKPKKMEEYLERATVLHASTILADGHNDLPWAIGKGFSQAEQADKPALSVEGVRQ